MGRSGFLIILLIFMVSVARAQKPYDFRQVDSITYASTLTEDWKEVIGVGKQALQNDIDYFYLRLRLGMAYYNKKNYRRASVHFDRASRFNPDHSLTRDYQYHSYLYAGQRNEAAFMAGSMNAWMRESTGIEKPSFVSALYVESGPEFSDNVDKHEFKRLPPQQARRSQDLYGNSLYIHLGIKLQLHPRISMYAGFSNLSISKKASLQYAWNSPDSIVQHEWGFAKFFPKNPSIETSNYEYAIKQNSIYLNANILAGRGWSFIPAIHYVHVNTESISIANYSTQQQDTAYYIAELDSVVYFSYELSQFKIQAEPLILNNMVLSLTINKQISVFDLGIFGSWSNLNSLKQLQLGFSATYYPLGNLDLYGNTTFKGLMQEEETNMIFSQMIGFKLTKFLWVEGFGVFGNLRGTNESNAFTVYNISDQIKLKAGVNLTFVISPAVQLSLRYQYLQKQGYRSVYGPGGPAGFRVEELDYTNQSIIGGLKWTF